MRKVKNHKMVQWFWSIWICLPKNEVLTRINKARTENNLEHVYVFLWFLCEFKCLDDKRWFERVVVNMSALHAEGPGFKPQQSHSPYPGMPGPGWVRPRGCTVNVTPHTFRDPVLKGRWQHPEVRSRVAVGRVRI